MIKIGRTMRHWYLILFLQRFDVLIPQPSSDGPLLRYFDLLYHLFPLLYDLLLITNPLNNLPRPLSTLLPSLPPATQLLLQVIEGDIASLVTADLSEHLRHFIV
jgi:hypothetical protein